jgi:ribosomal protein L13
MLTPLKKVFEDHKIEMYYTSQYLLGPTMLMKIGELLELRKPQKVKKTIVQALIPNSKQNDHRTNFS